MSNINRDQYGKPDLVERQAPFSAQVGMWWLYFKWQWLRDSHGVQPTVQTLFASPSSCSVCWADSRMEIRACVVLVLRTARVTVTLALVYYMNFKYGASQAPELTDVSRAKFATATTSISGATRPGACGQRWAGVDVADACGTRTSIRDDGRPQHRSC
jgi:hypothetical protein